MQRQGMLGSKRASLTQLCSQHWRTCPKAEAVAPNGLVWPNAGACCPNGDGEVAPKGLEDAPKPAGSKGRVPINRRSQARSQRDPCSCTCTTKHAFMPSEAQIALSRLTSAIVGAHLLLQSQNSWCRPLWIRFLSVQVCQGSPRACSAAQLVKFITVSTGGCPSGVAR